MSEMNPYIELFEKQQQHFSSVVKKTSLWDRKQKLKAIRKWIKENQEFVVTELQKDFIWSI